MHSPEPWKLHQRSERPEDVDVVDAKDQCVLETDWIPGELERADYERIIACVNFLQEIPTEALLKILDDKQMHYNILELTKNTVAEAMMCLAEKEAT